MDTLRAEMAIVAKWSGGRSETGFNDAFANNNYGPDRSYTLGDGDNEVDAVYAQVITIDGAADETIDLSSLAAKYSNLYADFGFDLVKEVLIEVLANDDESDPASGVQVGNAASNSWQGWLSAGATVDVDYLGDYHAGSDTGRAVDGTHKNLFIANLDATNTATVRITIYGRKA